MVPSFSINLFSKGNQIKINLGGQSEISQNLTRILVFSIWGKFTKRRWGLVVVVVVVVAGVVAGVVVVVAVVVAVVVVVVPLAVLAVQVVLVLRLRPRLRLSYFYRGRGVDSIQTKQNRVAREQRNKYKPRTEQEQHFPIRHACRPADSHLYHQLTLTFRSTLPSAGNIPCLTRTVIQ